MNMTNEEGCHELENNINDAHYHSCEIEVDAYNL
jgi:hypothetical protein